MEHRLHSNNISVGVSSPWGPHSNNEIILPKTGAETESTIGMCVCVVYTKTLYYL